jgi:hypothetical protein
MRDQDGGERAHLGCRFELNTAWAGFVQLARDTDNPRGGSVRQSSSLANERQEPVDEEEVAEVVNGHVAVNTVRGQGPSIHPDTGTGDELQKKRVKNTDDLNNW